MKKKKATYKLKQETLQRVGVVASISGKDKSEIVETALADYFDKIKSTSNVDMTLFFKQAVSLAKTWRAQDTRPEGEGVEEEVAPVEVGHSLLPGDPEAPDVLKRGKKA